MITPGTKLELENDGREGRRKNDVRDIMCEAGNQLVARNKARGKAAISLGELLSEAEGYRQSRRLRIVRTSCLWSKDTYFFSILTLFVICPEALDLRKI